MDPAVPEDASNPVDMGERSHLDENGRPRIIRRLFTVAAEHAGQRVDHYLMGQIPRLSRNKLQRIIKTQLTRNGRPMKPNNKVAVGDELLMLREARPEPPCPRTFDVLLEDEGFYVISKPAGLPVHSSARYYFNTLTRVMHERWPEERVQICHRLDRETSGALVVARHREAAATLKQGFAKKRVEKTYLAIVHGRPPWREAHPIDRPLALVSKDARINIRMEVRTGGLPSRTEVQVVKVVADYALVECRPVTGRQHQIRAHLAAAGFPIVGDKLYTHGDEAFAAFCDDGMTEELLARFLLPRQALHAASIRFAHPETGEPVLARAPLPEDMQRFLAAAED